MRFVILTLFFSTFFYTENAYAQRKITSSVFIAPVVGLINQFGSIEEDFAHYRSDLYDYNTAAVGWKFGYACKIKLNDKFLLNLSLAAQKESYNLKEYFNTDNGNTSGKFVEKTTFIVVLPEAGISYCLRKLDSIGLYVGYGYKHILGINQTSSVYFRSQNPGSLLLNYGSSTPLTGGYNCLVLGLSKDVSNHLFNVGLYYQVAQGYTPKINYNHRINTYSSDGWSSPKLNSLLLQVNYNFRANKKRN